MAQGADVDAVNRKATVPERYQEGRGSAPRSRRTLALVSAAGFDFRPLDAALLERYFNEYVAAFFRLRDTATGRRPALPWRRASPIGPVSSRCCGDNSRTTRWS